MTQLTEIDIDLAARAYAAARSAVQDCHAQLNAYADVDENRPDGLDAEEYLEDMAIQLADQIRRAIDSVQVLLELLGLSAMRIDFERQVAAYKDVDFKNVEYFDEYYGAHNVVLDAVGGRLERIAPLISLPDSVKTERQVLARILRQTANYLDAIERVPTREKDIQDALHPALRLAFPDIIREAATPKQTKTYHPDFGIASIATAIELKFADDKQKAKSALGELYEDMKGYADSEFTFFIGIIYLTGAFLSQDQIDAEMQKVGTPKNWYVRLVFGAGQTKAKRSKAESAKGESK